MALVEIGAFADTHIAEMARGLLMAEGIDAVLFDSGLSSLGLGAMTPARLMVDSVDQARAERLLAELSA